VAPVNPWGGGDGELKSRVPGWNGRPVWGRERTTWLKFVASPASALNSAHASSSVPVSSPAKQEAANGTRAVKPEDTAAASPPAPASSRAPAVAALTKRATLTGHPALVHCVSVSPDGRKVVSGSATQFDSSLGRLDPNTLIVWDVADQGKTRVVIPLEQSITSLAVTPNSKSVVVPTDNGLSVFDLKTGRRSATLRGPARTNALCTAISADGKIVAGGFTTKEVVLWNLNSGKPLRTLRGHTSGVIALAFSPDGKQLASGGQDNSIRLWDVATGRAQRTLTAKDASSPVTCVVYNPDGSRLASVNSGDQPQFWDPGTGRQLLSLGGDEVLSYRFVCLSADGRRLATASFDPVKMKWLVVLWDPATGRRLASAEDGDGQVNAVAFTPDGATLVSSGGKTIKLWDITQR
jgi:WD40 repeat protein